MDYRPKWYEEKTYAHYDIEPHEDNSMEMLGAVMLGTFVVAVIAVIGAAFWVFG
jgi:ribosomal protein L30E